MFALVAIAGCGDQKAEDSDAPQAGMSDAPAAGSSAGTNAAGAGSSGAGSFAGSSAGTGPAGVGGAAGQVGMAGAAGAGDAGSAGTGIVIINSEACPTVDGEVTDGTAAPGFATLVENEPTDIFTKLTQLALSTEHLYYLKAREIWRTPLAGGEPELTRSELASTLLVHEGELIFSEMLASGTHRIAKAPLGSTDAPTEIATDLTSAPWELITDGTTLYFVSGEPGVVGKVALSGGTVEMLASDTSVNDIALLGPDLYALHDAALLRVPTSGGPAMMVATLFFGGDLTADMTSVYWADDIERTVKRWTPGTADPELLATGSNPFGGGPRGITVHDGMLLWAEGGRCGQLYTIGTDGTGLERRMEGFGEIYDIVVDQTTIYLADDNGLYRMDR